MDIAAVDCIDAAKTKELFSTLNHPVAGVFFLPVKLHDRLFAQLKSEDDWKPSKVKFRHIYLYSHLITFRIQVYDIKVKGLQVLLEAIDPASLDFLVLTSTTSALNGTAGKILQLIMGIKCQHLVHQGKQIITLHRFTWN